MPNSLRSQLSKLRYKGKITDEEYRQLIAKLDGHDKTIRPPWIPVKAREMTPEERELYLNEYDGMTIYDCELPDDGQEVLITTSWGAVEKTTFQRDSYNICYFECYEDEDDVIAWMPLPERYKEN